MNPISCQNNFYQIIDCVQKHNISEAFKLIKNNPKVWLCFHPKDNSTLLHLFGKVKLHTQEENEKLYRLFNNYFPHRSEEPPRKKRRISEHNGIEFMNPTFLLMNAKDNKGNSPLDVALQHEAEGDWITNLTSRGAHFANFSNDKKVKLYYNLVDSYGIDPFLSDESIDEPNSSGRTYLHIACNLSWPEDVQKLVARGADIFREDDEGMSPFQEGMEQSTSERNLLHESVKDMHVILLKEYQKKVDESSKYFLQLENTQPEWEELKKTTTLLKNLEEHLQCVSPNSFDLDSKGLRYKGQILQAFYCLYAFWREEATTSEKKDSPAYITSLKSFAELHRKLASENDFKMEEFLKKEL